jgi:hypothetical protein
MKTERIGVTEIILKLTDGKDLKFQPKDNPIIKIMKGVSEKNNPLTGVVEQYHNDKETLIIVCAPEEIKSFFDDEGDVMFWIRQALNK